MFIFANIDLKLRDGQQIDNGWWLKITNELALMDWYAQANNFGKVWYDLKMNSSHAHFHTTEAYLMALKCSNHKEKTSFSNTDLALMFNDWKYETKAKLLNEHGTILINRAGGFCIPSESIVVKAELKNEKLVFPDSDKKEIKIEQFPGGTHFYVSINTIPVVFNNQEKWDTRAEAQAAADTYLKTFSPQTKEDAFNE